RALRSRGSWHGLFAGLTAGLVAATATGLLIVASLFAQMNATSSTGIPHGMAYFLAEPGFSPSLPGNLVKQFDDDLHGARKVPMTYGSSDDRAGNSVAWWAFHNVDDVASIFPLTDRQRRQLQTAGSLRVTT
ncbi:ABC transporter permease, partial [Staphylococcus aureus]